MPPAEAALVQVVPLLVRTKPAVPGATKVTEFAPFPKITLLSVRVLKPVPPDATTKVVNAWTQLATKVVEVI